MSANLSAQSTSPLQVFLRPRRPAGGSRACALPSQASWRWRTTSRVIDASSDASATWSADVPSAPPGPGTPPLSTPSPPPPPPLSTPYTPLTPISIDGTGCAHSRRAIGPRRESGGVRDGTPHSPSSASWSSDSGDPNRPQDRLGGSLAPPPNRRRGTGGGTEGYRLRRERGGARGSLGPAGGG